LIIDNFIESFGSLLSAAKNGSFVDEVNPIDGVTYPLINRDLSVEVASEIVMKLSDLMRKPIANPFMFMRRSPKGVDCPHQAHSDASMGTHSLMLYINGEGGTSLLRHKESGIAYNPESHEFVNVITRDQNIADAWEITDMVNLVPNRAFIFRSDMIHRAEPIGGFGEGNEARTILTCFFS